MPSSYNSIHKWLTDHPELVQELGEQLYENIVSTETAEWTIAFNSLTREDCIAYIRNLTINRTYDGYIREKSVIYDGLATLFPDVRFDESPPELDQSGDVDYLGYVDQTGRKAFGIQIKPVTARANFGNYSVSERMKASFAEFQEEFGGKVFIVFSVAGEIGNLEVVSAITAELARLRV